MGMGQNLITLWYPMIRWFIQKKTNICGHRGRVLNYDTYLLDSKCCQYVELWLNSRGEHQNMFFFNKICRFSSSKHPRIICNLYCHFWPIPTIPSPSAIDHFWLPYLPWLVATKMVWQRLSQESAPAMPGNAAPKAMEEMSVSRWFCNG